MIAILILIVVFIVFSVYSCCNISGKISEQEKREENRNKAEEKTLEGVPQ